MADGVPITAGSGTNIATDDASAAGHVQIVKLAISADGSATVLPADAANGLDVDVTRLPALVASSAAIGKLAANSGVDIGDVDVTSLPALPAGTNNIGDVDVLTLPAIPAGTNNIGDVDVLTLPATPAGTNTIGKVGLVPQTAGGLTPYHLVAANSTNATVVKASAGQLFGYYLYNSNVLARKIAFHNAATTPTAGASIFFSVVVPPLSAANVEFANGIAFGTGISFTTVTGITDADATAVATSDLIINLFYS